MFHHRFSHLFHFRPLHYGATEKLGANQTGSTWVKIPEENLAPKLQPFAIFSIWRSHDKVFAGGTRGVVLHFDGTTWELLQQMHYDDASGLSYAAGPAFYDMVTGVWSPDGRNVFVVTFDAYISHYNGVNWTGRLKNTGLSFPLRSVWGSGPSDIYVVGDNGVILHFDGQDWIQHESGTTQHLYSVSGNSSTNVFVVGENGVILHFDGVAWTKM